MSEYHVSLVLCRRLRAQTLNLVRQFKIAHLFRIPRLNTLISQIVNQLSDLSPALWRAQQEHKMDYDDILMHLGEKGKWNIINMFLLWMGPFIAGFTVLVYSFTGMTLL